MEFCRLWRTAIFWIFAALCVCAVVLNSTAGPPKQADRIVVVKSKRTMSLMSGSEVLKTYKVALGGQPLGAKDRQGDHKTPEGIYSVDICRSQNSQQPIPQSPASLLPQRSGPRACPPARRFSGR